MRLAKWIASRVSEGGKAVPRGQRECEHLTVPFEVKAFDDEQNTVEGYASVFGVMDLGRDIVERGAFKKTIQERVPRGKVKFVDSHYWDVAHTHGVVLEAREDEFGLWFKARLSSAPSSQDVRIKLKEGIITELSIGYDAVKEEWEKLPEGGYLRHLKEVKLYEISAVPFGMNEETFVTSVKAVVPFQDLPLADEDREWDRAAAERRVRDWAGRDEVNWAKYRRAFIWYDDGNPEALGSYKLQVGDIVDERLVAVPRAVFACAVVVQGGRGGVDIPDDEMPAVKRHIEKYYAKMDREAPWEREEASLGHIEALSPGLAALVEELTSQRHGLKEGRVLSARNRALIEEGVTVLKEAIKLLEELLAAAESGRDGKSRTTHGQGSAGQAEPARSHSLRLRARLLGLETAISNSRGEMA